MGVFNWGWATLFANVLIPVGILIFSSGFFPYKPLLPGLATFEQADQDATSPVFDKVVFMVVDALRSDFVYSNESGFLFTQSLIRSGVALPFTAHASSPTVTMPRLKAMTTGSVPSFLDVILNIAESDTSSNLAFQDTWLAQIKARGDQLVMYGDDTWLKLFPGMFGRSDGTTSFFVSDFVEVDNNVTRHIPDELAQSDWSAMIMHYLGLDHIGHKAGPKSSHMLPKQQEMDTIVNQVYTQIEQQPHLQSTLFVLCGDHGMNDAGNHGGASAGETSPALLFISPKFASLDLRQSSPIEPFDDLQYYRTVEQADITPTLAGLLGLPVPLNSLGVFIPEFLDLWDDQSTRLHVLYRNARQLLNTVQATFPSFTFDAASLAHSCMMEPDSSIEGARCAWSRVLRETSSGNVIERDFEALESSLLQFSRIAQNLMSSTASNYDVSRLSLGLLITAVAALVVSPITYQECRRSTYTGFFLLFLIIGYGSMMFASSYVEEEQQFWYWICSGWMVYLHIRSASSNTTASSSRAGFYSANAGKTAILGFAIALRLVRRWNQTGQKFAAEPDIARAFFPSHRPIFWALFMLTYADAGLRLWRSLPSTVLKMGGVTLAALACVFKLNFVANDSPELIVDTILSRIAEGWPSSTSLVLQARLIFSGLGGCVLIALALRSRSDENKAPSKLLHEALHLFLMTQSRATNIPLFLVFRIAVWSLSSMELSDMEVTITTMILQYTSFFAFGGSNAISSVDLSSAYNGVGSYSVAMVGILTFVSNWAGPIWWVSAGHLLRGHQEHGGESHNAAALLTFHVAASALSVMAACTALRTHLFIWTVFSPKYLYTIAWATANHVAVNLLGVAGLSLLERRR